MVCPMKAYNDNQINDPTYEQGNNDGFDGANSIGDHATNEVIRCQDQKGKEECLK